MFNSGRSFGFAVAGMIIGTIVLNVAVFGFAAWVVIKLLQFYGVI